MSERIETAVLDAQGLSSWIAGDRRTQALIKAFEVFGTDLVVCANTIVEVSHARVNTARLDWTLSRVRVEPVTAQSARAAARLLKENGLHGHKYALDATVAELALRQRGPVAVLTSDVDDMTRLCGPRVRLVPC
ncbi:PIN domain-containing protein [Streptomyces sp. NPDC097619]|uniref:PIN domain-containing protein n=1 Tax=Streptomyces sp. NPDC097619 TaxID=3157228 RepID=UPI0033168400